MIRRPGEDQCRPTGAVDASCGLTLTEGISHIPFLLFLQIASHGRDIYNLPFIGVVVVVVVDYRSSLVRIVIDARHVLPELSLQTVMMRS